jgi:hypothetical protein
MTGYRFDLLVRVVRAEPVVVRGAHGFGPRSVTKAMRSLGLIETNCGEGPMDGLGATVGAWWCDHEAEWRGCTQPELDLMHEIRDYNGVDCKAMMEILRCLREHH